MSQSKKENQLLGKKRELEREKESEEEEKEKEEKSSQKKQKKLDNKTKKQDPEVSSNSSNSSGSEPRQSLFGKNETGFSKGLFGDLDNEKKSTGLFGDLNNPQKSTGLFGDLDNPQKSTSLFGKPTEGTSFFTSTGGSLFGNIQSEPKPSGGLFGDGLFNFSQINNEKKDEPEQDEGEGDDNIGKGSPKHEYNPENDNNEKKPDKDGYIKRYIKKVDNALLYDKLRKVFVSKGEGFLIIESQEKENEDKTKKRFARILYRNTIGGIIFQGVFNDQINKCIVSEKNLKHICLIVFVVQDSDNNLTFAQAKIPFTTEGEIKLFEEKYKNTIKYIKNEVDDY